MRIFRVGHSRVRHSQSATAERDRLFQPRGRHDAKPGIAEQSRGGEWTARPLFCASEIGCCDGKLADDMSRQWILVAEIHQRRMAVSGKHDAAGIAELAT